MVYISGLFFSTLGQPMPFSGLSIEKCPQGFTVKQPTGNVIIPISRKPTRNKSISLFDRNDLHILWNEKGLQICNGTHCKMFQLNTVPYSKALFNSQLIQSNKLSIERGTHQAVPSRLVGHTHCGHSIYGIFQWQDTTSKPWFDALIKIDLSRKEPKPRVVGLLPGFSPENSKGLTAIYSMPGKIQFVRVQGNRWYLMHWDPTKPWEEKSVPKTIGFRLLHSGISRCGTRLVTVEKTHYNTLLASQIDLNSLSRSYLTESREYLRPKALDSLVFKVRQLGRTVLRCAKSGAEMAINNSYKAIPLPNEHIFIYCPKKNPTWAAVYHPIDWKLLAVWKADIISQGNSLPKQAAVHEGFDKLQKPPVQP